MGDLCKHEMSPTRGQETNRDAAALERDELNVRIAATPLMPQHEGVCRTPWTPAQETPHRKIIGWQKADVVGLKILRGAR